MKKLKKRKKLIFQISIIIVPVFLVMLASVVFSMAESTYEAYAESQNSNMERQLEQIEESVFFSTSSDERWYIDYWEKYPEIVLSDITPEEEAAFDEHIEEPDLWKPEWLLASSEIVQRFCAKSHYQSVDYSVEYEAHQTHADIVFVLDVQDNGKAVIISEYSNCGISRRLGDVIDFSPEEHTVIQDILDKKSDKIVFERFDDFTDSEDFYIGYKPYIIDGEVIAVVGLAYEWETFVENTVAVMRRSAMIGLYGVLTAAIILYMLLYFKAVDPLTRIQRTVRDYIADKNSGAVAERMSRIKGNNEFTALAENISEMTGELERYNTENIRLAAERERASAELNMAKSIQASQLPSDFPAFPDRKEFDIFASMTPAKEVGGDFYDFFLIDEDHLAMTIADVSGKGVPAALFMMMSKMLINNYATMGLSPHEVLEKTNETICKNNKQKMFVTVWFGILEISTGKITAANAGHEYPVIRQPDGSFELFKDKHGFVIGGMKNKKYKEYEFTLQKGGTLFVYTDGVPEATNAAEEMFGTERLVDTLNAVDSDSPEELLTAVHNAVNGFVGEAPQFDDLTMLGITLSK